MRKYDTCKQKSHLIKVNTISGETKRQFVRNVTQRIVKRYNTDVAGVFFFLSLAVKPSTISSLNRTNLGSLIESSKHLANDVRTDSPLSKPQAINNAVQPSQIVVVINSWPVTLLFPRQLRNNIIYLCSGTEIDHIALWLLTFIHNAQFFRFPCYLPKVVLHN